MRFPFFLLFFSFLLTVDLIHARSSSMADNAEKQCKCRKKVNTAVFHNEDEISVSLAKYMADLSNKFTTKKGAFTVVLSGGTIMESLRYLTKSPYLSSVDWAKWHVFWVDERVVSKDSSESNYKGAYDDFLSKVPIPSENVYAINDTLTAEGAAEEYETRLRKLVKKGVIATSHSSGFPEFDVMLLGMGEDGHIASLFPGHPQIKEKEKWVTFIENSPKPPPKRITFTSPVINSSEFIAMYVLGADKADPVAAAVCHKHGNLTYPVQMVSAKRKVTWFLDREAASKLPANYCGTRAD